MDNLEILAGSSLPLPEQSDPDQSQLDQEASNEYDGQEIVASIGTTEFKKVFMIFIQNIMQQPIVDQRRLCLDILSKVKDVYDYSFLPYPDLDHQLDMNNVYDLVKFLNYDNLDFISDVWRYLDVDLKKVDIKQFCYDNDDRIVSEIDEQINSRDLSKMVSLFIRTYIKDKLIDWFIDVTEKNRMLIYLRILQGN